MNVLRYVVLLCVVLALAGRDAGAAVPELVGVAALAADSEVAKVLDLDDEQQQAIRELILRRETAGFESAMRYKDASAEERSAALRPFRIESQRQLLSILTDDQIAKLEALRTEKPDANYEPLLAGDDEPAAVPAVMTAEEAAPTTDAAEMAPATEPVAPEAAAAAPETTTQPADAAPATEPSSELTGPLTEPADDATTEEGAPTPITEAPIASSSEAQPSDGKLVFNFRYQPWQDVLDWFAEQAGLSLLIESPPSGTFNYTDPRRYTPAEALDVLNSVLLTKGFTLVRRERMLVLVNLEDGVPPNLVTDVDVKDLDGRGEYELVRVLFKLRNMSPAVAAEEIQRMVGPQGSVVLLPRAGMIQVTETAGRCRAIRDVIAAVEEPTAAEGGVQPFKLKYVLATDVLPVLRQMLGMDPEKSSTEDGTLQIAVDTLTGERILVTGTPEKIARVKQVIELVDVPEAAALGSGVDSAPQLEVHSTAGADPESVLLVLQTLLAETPGLRLATDPLTGNVVALASPADQATIRATIQQMRADARQVAVIPLITIDPQLAVLAISKLFGGSGTPEKPDPRAPIIDADLTTNTLFVRATPGQIDEIKKLLADMGETTEAAEGYAQAQKGNVRTLPLSGSAARTALTQIEKLWPVMRPNPIRVIVPSTGIQSYRPGGETTTEQPNNGGIDFGFDMVPEDFLAPPPTTTRPAPQAAPPQPAATQPDRSTGRGPRVSAHLAVMQNADVPPVAAAEPDAAAVEDQINELADTQSTGEVRNRPGAPVLIAPGAGGTIIASEDLEALDALENLLSVTAGSSYTSTREYAVFYLKYAQAPAAAATLNQMFGGGSGGSTSGGLMGGIAGAALGDLGGGLMGDLLGLGGGTTGSVTGFSAGAVDIVADARLNLLLVYAQASDIEMVNQVLQVLDQSAGPEEVEAGGKARLIPVLNTSAEQIAAVVRTVYADRLQSSGGGGQPSPEDIIRALRRGGEGGGGGEAQEPEKMSIGVDERSNSLVVRASDPLFAQVQALVEQLDQQQSDQSQSTQIVSLKFSNSDAMRQALAGVFGDEAVTTTSPSSGRSGGDSDRAESSSDDARRAAEDARRRIEFFQRIQEQMRQGGGGPPGSGRGGPPSGGDRGGRGGR